LKTYRRFGGTCHHHHDGKLNKERNQQEAGSKQLGLFTTKIMKKKTNPT
jgi:hypothetical protein